MIFAAKSSSPEAALAEAANATTAGAIAVASVMDAGPVVEVPSVLTARDNKRTFNGLHRERIIRIVLRMVGPIGSFCCDCHACLHDVG